MKQKDIENWLIQQIGTLKKIDQGQIDVHSPFVSYGLSSTDAVALSGELQELLDRTLSPSLVYEYPSIDQLAVHLSNGHGQETSRKEESPGLKGMSSEPVAVIGISCRFPGAEDKYAYWQLLKDGVDAISKVPADRWAQDRFSDTQPGKTTSEWGGFLSGIDQFDPWFFGISPAEAEQIDPQQRLLLELSYEALQDAGKDPAKMKGSATGVYVGISVNEYSLRQFNDPLSIISHSGTGSALSIAANRISYQYDFKGPSMAIDTACSSSLTAIHQACKSLRSGECDLAIAGGVNMILSPAHSIAFGKAGVLATDGRCKTFDAGADGYVRGEGGGLVILKPLSAAIADGDRIYACLNGSAINQDGRSNGLMAPNRVSQEALLTEACYNAGISPDQVQYVEAHGTGTLLGDQMEASAIGAVMGNSHRTSPCLLGSVKSNIGHLEAAAGVAGLIKVILSMSHGEIPQSLHYHSPNPSVPFDEMNLKVADQLTPWPEGEVKTAGISSFGFGGTNVHLIVTKPAIADQSTAQPVTKNAFLLPISAKTPKALTELAGSFLQTFDNTPSLSGMCKAAGIGRAHHHVRAAVAGTSREAIRAQLEALANGNEDHISIYQQNQPGKVVFVFPGQGGQWHGMARSLLQLEPVFHDTIMACAEIIREGFGWSLMDVIHSKDTAPLENIGVIQPMLFSIQVGLSALWQSWGIQADAVIGHSMGEVAAACHAGALSLKDGIKVICTRSQLLTRFRGTGSMLLADLTKEEATALIAGTDGKVSIAAINSPQSMVLSGSPEAIKCLMETLEAQNRFHQLVKVDIASHHPMMEDCRDELLDELDMIEVGPTQLPFYSTVAGGQDRNLVLGPDYWAENLIRTVRFEEASKKLMADGYHTFIEIGPHPVLLGSLRQTAAVIDQTTHLLPSLKRDEDEQLCLYQSLVQLYNLGNEIYWTAVYQGDDTFRDIPYYPWQRQRFWIEERPSIMPAATGNVSHKPLLGQSIPLAHTPDTSVWQLELDRRRFPFLEDHRLGDELILPATFYLEMAAEAMSEVDKGLHLSITDAVFEAPLTIGDTNDQQLQISLKTDLQNGSMLQVFSRQNALENDWTCHFTATILPRQKPTKGTAMTDIELDIDHRIIPGNLLYQQFEQHGIVYGPDFQLVKSIKCNERTAIGELDIPTSKHNSSYLLHPAQLDACLQVPGPLVSETTSGTYLPVGCKSYHIHQPSALPKWCVVSVDQDHSNGSNQVTADISIFDDQQQLIAQLTGFSIRKISTDIHKGVFQNLSCYETRWQQTKTPTVSSNGMPATQHWLILSDEDQLLEALQQQLADAGDTSTVIPFPVDSLGNSISGSEKIRQVIASALALAPAVDGVIHLWSQAIQTPDSDDDSTVEMDLRGSLSVLQLVQLLADRTDRLPKLWLVTADAMSVAGNQLPNPAQATLWGLGKTIGFELPELECTRIDVESTANPYQSADLLISRLKNPDAEDQVAFRGGTAYVPRIVPFRPKHQTLSANPIKTDSTYLITGGLGAIGFKTAEWMVGKGVHQLVLLGRSAPSKAQQSVIAKWQEAGVNVIICEADVSDKAQINEVIQKIREHLPPLKGIMHAAGVLEDGALVNMDVAAYEKVIRPKVSGTLNLHHATAALDLDFFVLFSSAVSVLGSPGQGNYAAASAFIDAFAHFRKQQGMPSLSINWGPWAEAGLAVEANDRLAAESTAADHLVKMITPDEGIAMMEALLPEQAAQLSVLPFDLSHLLELYPAASEIPFFEHARESETYVSRHYARPNLAQEYIAPGNEVEKKLVELWQQTLHIDRVGSKDSFFELGGDSVLGAQIISSVQRTFGIKVNIQDAFKAFTIEHIAQLIEQALIEKISQMSESEVAEHLNSQ